MQGTEVLMADFARENRGAAADRSEESGERMLGRLLDQAHEGRRRSSLRWWRQVSVRSVAGMPRSSRGTTASSRWYLPGQGLAVEDPVPIDGSRAGEVFLRAVPAARPQADRTRMFLPLLDGGDEVGGSP